MPTGGLPGGARRVLIYGVTGSGKTTLAARLADITGIEWHSVDDLTWEPGWVEVPSDEQRRRIQQICQRPEWILDTAYGKWLDLPLRYTQLIIALDYPRWFSLQRLVRRTVARLFDRRLICNGNRESLRGLFSRDAIIVWHFRSFNRKRQRIHRWSNDPAAPRVLRFTSSRQTEDWLSGLRASTQSLARHRTLPSFGLADRSATYRLVAGQVQVSPHMSTYPEMSVQDRAEQPYVGMTASVTIGDFSPVIDRASEIFGRLAEREIQPAGPPFFRYKVIDMERELVIEAGVPVAAPLVVDGLDADVLPAGRYVETTFTGHPDRLMTVTADLLRWADDQGLVFEQHTEPQGHVWGCRLELYETDPDDEPDMNRWTTTLAFRLAD